MKPPVLIHLLLCLIGIYESVFAQQTSNSIVSNQTLSTQAISINIQTTNAACNTKTGSITINAAGGIPPYQYTINGEGPFSNGFYPAVEPGTYSIQVKDADGNTASASATVNNTNSPPVLSVTSFTNPSTCNNDDGSFVVAPSGGTAPYQFTLDLVNFSNIPSFSNLAAGFYTVMVRDAKGCVGEVRVTLTNSFNCGIPIAVTYPSPICNTEGTVSIKYFGSDLPYESSLNGAPFTTATGYANIAPGAYTLQVRSGTGETTTFMFYVVKGCSPFSQAIVVDNTCNAANGTVTLTTSSGSPPYRYSIDGVSFQTSNIFTGLAAGRYSIGVTDAAGAVTRTEAAVNGGCFVVSETHSDVLCGSADGTIEVTPSGGVEPYSYSLNDGAFQPLNFFDNLSPRIYRITVMDASGSTKSISVEIKNISGPTQITPVAAPGCLNDVVKMTVAASGGTAPFQYSINDVDYQLSPQFDVVTGQSYTVFVRDANGCRLSRVYEPPVECFQIAITTTEADCGVNNGTLQVDITNGNPPFEYSIDGTNFQTSNIFSNMMARAYQLTVRDAQTNTRTMAVEVRSTCPQLQVTIQNASCGNANGTITASGTSGQPPYQFSFNNGAYSTQGTFTSLSDGTYIIAMRDALGYVVQRPVVVANTTNPQLLSVVSTDAVCSTGGTIDITASGGTGALWYSVDGTNFSSNPKFTQVQAGVYQVYVADNLGCKTSEQAEVNLVMDLSLQITPEFSICDNEPAIITVLDPKPTYNYLWSADDGSVSSNAPSLNVTPHVTTTYTVQVTDGLCAADASTAVTVHPLPVANAGENITVCYGKSTRLNGSGGYSYAWSPSTYLSDGNSANPDVINPIATQEYQLTVKNEYGCASAVPSSVVVTVAPPVEVFAGKDTIVVKGVPFQLNAIDLKNSGFINYDWTPSMGLSDPRVQNPVATLQSSTVYTVKATTVNGCESIDDINIQAYTGPDIYVPNAFSPNNDGVNDEFRIFPVGIKGFKYLAVYNRWGSRVYYSADISKGWNGFIGPQRAETGSYVWIVEGVDVNNRAVVKRGVVQLVR